VYKETVEKTRLENDRLCLEAKEGLLECETALVKIAAKERDITNQSDLVARYRKQFFFSETKPKNNLSGVRGTNSIKYTI